MTDLSQQVPPSSLAWTCPTCGRRFHRTGQSCVCDTTTVEAHLHD